MTSGHSRATALITGASTGIGAVYADRLAARGLRLILVARDERRLHAAAQRLREHHGAEVEAVRADLTVPADVARIERRLLEDRDITLLVNNAGSAVEGKFATCDIGKIEQMLTLNILTPTRLARAAAERMAMAGAGTIINIGSVTSLLPESFSGPYSGSKAYILNLSIAMQTELQPQGVRVQAVLPGATRTELWERAGMDIATFPPEMVMDAGALVDAALAGLDMGESVTIPSLPDIEEWNRYNAARLALAPNLSRSSPARRLSLL